jgi:hypothetical protein
VIGMRSGHQLRACMMVGGASAVVQRFRLSTDDRWNNIP